MEDKLTNIEAWIDKEFSYWIKQDVRVNTYGEGYLECLQELKDEFFFKREIEDA